MAKSISFRSFEEGGDIIHFSSLKFRTAINNYIQSKKDKGEKCTKEEVYNRIADIACVSYDAVKKWNQGHNGPGDLDTIKKIAFALGIDTRDIIVSGENSESRTIEQEFSPMFTKEEDLINQIYRLFVDYCYWFCGTETCYADKVLENPMDEQQKYVRNLYHFLDQIALSISRETYSNLRQIITQLDQIYSTYHGGLPKLWVELNPLLGTELFDELYWSDSEDIESFVCDECQENPKELFHMLFEDMPDYEEVYRKCMRDKRLKSWFGIIENSLPGQRNWYLYTSPYDLVARELSNTLYKVMKYYFPHCFRDNKSLDIEKNGAIKKRQEKKTFVKAGKKPSATASKKPGER